MTQADDEQIRQDAADWWSRHQASDRLTPAQTQAFSAWISTPTHRAAYARLEERFETAGVLAQSRLEGLRAKPRPRVGAPSSPLGWAALAAGLLVLIGAGLALGPGKAWRASSTQRFVTQIGEIRTVILVDGATMTLDTDSAAVLSVRSGERHLRLEQGRARFSLTPKAGALAVEAGDARIQATNTTFDLGVAGDHAVDVALIEGRIEGGAIKGVRFDRLRPGQHWAIADTDARAPQPTPTVAQAWPTGMRTFDRTPLAQVVAEANRYDRVKIRLAESDLGALEVSGAFRVTGTERLAKALAAAFGLTLTHAPGGDIVLSRAAA